MSLDGFRNLLLQKTENNELLNLTVSLLDEALLHDYVIESLEKMSDKEKMQGRHGNALLARWGTHMNVGEPHMLHDALSHHASHYKAALKKGDQKTADQHMRKVFDIMQFMGKARKYASNKVTYDAVPPHAWQRNHYQNRVKPGDKSYEGHNEKKDATATKVSGWNFAPKTGFDHLQGRPSLDHKDTKNIANEVHKEHLNDAYPLEKIKIKVGEGDDKGKHLHIDDDVESFGFKSHPFDSHPIMAERKTQAKDVDHEKMGSTWDSYNKWLGGGEVKKWKEDHRAKAKENPIGYSMRGDIKAEPVHSKPIGEDVIPGAKPSPKVNSKSAPKTVESMVDSYDNDIDPELAAMLKG